MHFSGEKPGKSCPHFGHNILVHAKKKNFGATLWVPKNNFEKTKRTCKRFCGLVKVPKLAVFPSENRLFGGIESHKTAHRGARFGVGDLGTLFLDLGTGLEKIRISPRGIFGDLIFGSLSKKKKYAVGWWDLPPQGPSKGHHGVPN